jgi:hypothetical protein
VGALLAGIVALNVGALRLNVEAQRHDARIERLEARRADLLARLSSATSTARIQAAAAQLGLVPAEETRYVAIEPRKSRR